MKKISLILLLFLLPLCLVPPTAAVYGDESPDSITSFSETLPDDVLYFPDSFADDTIELADYGEISDESYSADYILTHVKDGSAFNETTATDIEIWFEVDTTVAGFEGFSYAHYMNVDSGTDVDLAAYDFDQDLFVKIDEPVPSSYAWMNGTIYNPDYWNTTHIAFTMYELSGTADLYWDYGEITIHRMTLADSDHYAEGFNDVSDWVEESFEGNDAMSSDGDVLTVVFEDNDNADQPYTNAPTLPAGSYYAEIRYKTNVTGFNVALYSRTANWGGGDLNLVGQLAATTTWTTLKFYHPYQVECVYFYTVAPVDFELNVDYLRISPANETGWQHDGSTIEGVTNPAHSDMDYVISSDGDILTLTVDQVVGGVGSGALQTINYDTTSTVIDLDRDYYSFFEIRYRVTLVTACEPYLRVYIDGEYTSESLDLSGDWVTLRLNLHDSTAHASSGIWFSAYMNHAMDIFTVEIDYVKIYSIADFMVTHGAVSSSDYLYTDSGVLISSKTTTNLIYVNGYPDPSVDNSIYAVWNVSASNIETDSFKFTTHLFGGGWVSSSYDQTRESLQVGITDDWYISFSGDVSISAVKFIDTRDWHEIGEVEFVIPVGWDPTFIFGYDAFFIFLGLILIPVSTMYLVRGGREEASADKVFYFLIMFMIGFGLLVGGIMP